MGPLTVLRSVAQRKKKIIRAAKATVKRNVIVAGDSEKTSIDETKFKNPIHCGSLVIRYYP